MRAVATFASVAPFTTRFDWFAGMQAPGALRAAEQGREARERFAATDEFDPQQFVARDWSALSGAWQGLGLDARAEEMKGPAGVIDDDVALVTPWGFDLAAVAQPVLLVHGGADRVIPLSHGREGGSGTRRRTGAVGFFGLHDGPRRPCSTAQKDAFEQERLPMRLHRLAHDGLQPCQIVGRRHGDLYVAV